MTQRDFCVAFYDFDGTLIDSVDGIEWAARAAVAEVLPERNLHEIRRFIGPPIREVFQAALRAGGDEASLADIDALERCYRKLYDEAGCLRCSLFPGVRAGLERRRQAGIQQFVVTNKPQAPTRKICDALGLQPLITEWVSPDSRTPHFSHKGESTLYLLKKYRHDARHVLFVGDARDDAHAAQYAEVAFAAVSYGYGNAHHIQDVPRLAVIDDFAQLDSWLDATPTR